MREGALIATDDMLDILSERAGVPIGEGLDPLSIWTPSIAEAALTLPPLRWTIALGHPKPKTLSFAIFGHIRRVRQAKRIIREHLQEEA